MAIDDKLRILLNRFLIASLSLIRNSLILLNIFPPLAIHEHNPFNPKDKKWYSPCLDLDHTILVSRGERFYCLKYNVSHSQIGKKTN